MSDANTATQRPIPWLIAIAALVWLTFNCSHDHELAQIGPIAKPPSALAPALALQPAPAAEPTPVTEPPADAPK